MTSDETIRVLREALEEAQRFIGRARTDGADMEDRMRLYHCIKRALSATEPAPRDSSAPPPNPGDAAIMAMYEPETLAAMERSSSAPGEAWQDISTAPKDGRWLILWNPTTQAPVLRQWRMWQPGIGEAFETWVDEWSQQSPSFQPTHWMSWVGAPQPAAGEGGE